ncbi:hypothetical protein NFI96_004399 [Prochilodus magdalenae]|nr:hypothetical protein NFI96_004399 [Prochilodus magdalenae]
MIVDIQARTVTSSMSASFHRLGLTTAVMSFAFVNSSSSISPTASHLTSPSPGPDLKDQCPTDSIMFLVSVEIITAVIGFPGNVCVIYLLLRGEVGRPTSDVFTLSLAVLDTVYCLFLPLHMHR